LLVPPLVALVALTSSLNLLIRAKDLLFGAKAAANGDAKTRKPGVEAAVAATGSRYALAKLLKISKVAVQKNGTAFRPTELFDGDWPPRVTLMDLIVEARTVNWDFNDWCDAGGYDASDPDARRMFECLLAYARREGRAGLN
jgi:hypothetical protein